MVSYLASNLQEALECRVAYGAVPYGGGTDLMISPDDAASYLFLHRVPEMREIREDGPYLRIGASCTFTEVERHPLCPALLREAILQIAAPAIRNLGTIGGNIGNGSPKADSALIFFVADAKLRLASVRGERIVPIQAFYKGRGQLELEPDELIVEVLLPKAGLDGYYYKKVGGRDALAISRISFAALMEIRDGVIRRCATAFGAVSDVILRRDDIDGILVGLTVEEAKARKEEYLFTYDQALRPIRGRVSEGYRKAVCRNLLRDFLDTWGI